MLESIKQRLGRDDEQGFTLIELMVVVLIIAILLAIAIPTFLGAKNQANARAAQSSLRNALTAEQTYWTNNQNFGDSASTPTLASIEPNLTWAAAAVKSSSNTIGVVGIDPATTGGTDYQQVFLQSWGKDGKCYTVFQDNDPNSTLSVKTLYSFDTSCAATTAAPTTVNSGKAVAGGGFYTSW
jgi:type IV pilus assembly protein PilA